MTRRDQALAQLAQQLQVPERLLNLYPPAANHWTGVDDALQDWRDAAWRHYAKVMADIAAEVRRWSWEELYEGPPQPTCYRVPCPPWPRELDQSPDPCSIGDCLTCPGSAVGCGCYCHWGEPI